MITDSEKFRIPDENKQHDFYAEVNWDKKNALTNECKIVRFTFPNGSEALVKKEYLHAILFAIGNEAEQQKLTPQITRTSRWYESTISVKATKDIKKGEEITFPLKLSLPTLEEERIGSPPKESKILMHNR